MRIVIDTNVFVSGAIWYGLPKAVVDRVFKKNDILLLSDKTLGEILEVFSRTKFDNYKEQVEEAVKGIKKFAILTPIPPDLSVADSGCRDPKDVMYLECAVAGNADYLISGDADLHMLKNYRGVTIASPREYLDIVG